MALAGMPIIAAARIVAAGRATAAKGSFTAAITA
jgi:hypothetical protein